jgi:hypothetical protein
VKETAAMLLFYITIAIVIIIIIIIIIIINVWTCRSMSFICKLGGTSSVTSGVQWMQKKKNLDKNCVIFEEPVTRIFNHVMPASLPLHKFERRL